MALSRDFRQTVQARAARDPAFREACSRKPYRRCLAATSAQGARRCATTSMRRLVSKD
jgi:hypothetical protein